MPLLSNEDLGQQLRLAIPQIIEQEIRQELGEVQQRIADRVRARLGNIKTSIESVRKSMTHEIIINVTIGLP